MCFDDLLSVPSLWDILREEKRPVLLYGTGNGADKILDMMDHFSIPCAGVFASDGFVRNRDFRGMRVISYSDAREKFGDDTVILCAFGSPREEVLSFLGELDRRHTLYIPDVPLFCDDLTEELFTKDYLLSHRKEIEECAGLWEDEESRLLYFELLAYRLTGQLKYLSRTEDFSSSVKSLLPADTRRVIDGGAFVGDTAQIFISAFAEVESVICVEPDPATFRKLSAFAENDLRIRAVNAMLGGEAGVAEFMSCHGRASSAQRQNKRSKTVSVPKITADSLSEGTSKLLLKLDVEGAEKEALEGAEQIITQGDISLAVALYHRTEDIFALPLMIRKMRPQLKMNIRRVRCVPAWELTLFCRLG